MSDFTTEELAAIRSEITTDPEQIGYPSWDGEQSTALTICHQLVTRPLIDNPEPAPQVPKPLVVADLLDALSPEGVAYIASQNLSDLEPIGARIREQDRAGVVNWMLLKKLAGEVSEADYAAILAVCSATIDDPNHPEQVYGDNRLTVLLGREIGSLSPSDVIAAMEVE